MPSEPGRSIEDISAVGMPAAETLGAQRRTDFMLTEARMVGTFAMQADVLRSPEVIEAEVLDYGILSAVEWPGKVSAQRIVDRDPRMSGVILEAASRIGEFYVPVNPGARTRCIDGRQDPEYDEKNLGPQVPGGAPGAALAWRLGVDKDELTRGTFVDDAEVMINRFLQLGFAPGGHRDEHSSGDEATVGCGAIDGMDKITEIMVGQHANEHKAIVRSILGSHFDRDAYLHAAGAATQINARSESYFRDRKRIIDILENRARRSIATLQGDHQECIVAVNFVPGTTLASNRLNEEFTGMQAFGYDIWRSVQMAGKLMPRAEQKVDRERFIMARVMTTVATLMALTDGSQRLVMRTPKLAAAA